MIEEEQDKIHSEDNSETHDTSSVLISQSSHCVLPVVLQAKVGQALNRSFFNRLKQAEQSNRKYKNNLAYIIAGRMPENVRGEVLKMVMYYQQHMQDQLAYIHKLVQQNQRMKHKMEQIEDKQNMVNLNSAQTACIVGDKTRKDRASELQSLVHDKNKQIANLNREITDLLGKVKKYKKRIYQLQAKSPAKLVKMEFQGGRD